MKRLLLILLLSLPLWTIAQLQYPETKKEDVKDDYHGTPIADPYRWLEDDNSEETKAWVAEQNKVTNTYLAGIPYRDKVKKRLEELWNYPRYSSPTKKGEYYYFYKNDGLQNQSILYRQKGLSGKPQVFFDPNKLSSDGTVALGTFSFSKKNKYIGYTVSMSGSDWQEAFVMDVATGKSNEI